MHTKPLLTSDQLEKWSILLLTFHLGMKGSVIILPLRHGTTAYGNLLQASFEVFQSS